MLIPLIICFLIALVIYLPVNRNAGGLFFSGFWRFEDFIVQPSLGTSQLELARRIYAANNNLLRSFLYGLFFGLLYIIFSSGILILGLIQTKFSLKKLTPEFAIFCITGVIATCAAGFFFLQKTGGANSSQFLISIYIMGTLFTALALSSFTLKLPRFFYFILILFIVTIASIRVAHDTYMRVYNTVAGQTGVQITQQQLDSYNFLKTLRDGTVLVADPNNLDCVFINFLGNKPTYSCLTGAPTDRGVDLSKRLSFAQQIINQTNPDTITKKTNQKSHFIYLYS